MPPAAPSSDNGKLSTTINNSPQNGAVQKVVATESLRPALAHPHSVVFAFRENGRYEGCVDQIKARLVAEGYSVHVFSVPRATTADQVDIALDESARHVRSGILITDRTVKKSWTPINCQYCSPPTVLDDIFSAAAQYVVQRKCSLDQVRELPRNMRDRKEVEAYVARCGPVFVELFQAVFKEWSPEAVVIFSPHLKDHPPFAVSDFARFSSPEKILGRWLVQAGYPKAQIVVARSVLDLIEEAHAPRREILFLGDRHYLNREEIEKELAQLLDDADEFGTDDEDELEEEFGSRRDFILDEYRMISEILGLGRSDRTKAERKPWIQFPAENLIPTLVDSGVLSASKIGSPDAIIEELYEMIREHIENVERQLRSQSQPR